MVGDRARKNLRELVGQTRLDQVGVKERGVIAGFILRPSGQRDQRGLTLIRTGADLARVAGLRRA